MISWILFSIVSQRAFIIMGCSVSCFIPCEFIFLKLLVAQLPNFEFPLDRIIIFGFNSLKGIIYILVALLSINISLRPLWS